MEYYNIKEDEVFPKLKELEPLTVASHHDADGVYSAVLLSKLFEIDEIDFPPEFGHYDVQSVSLDLGQSYDPEWDGLAIDHHPHDMEERKYSLVRDHVPTGLIVYQLFKDRIPTEWTWLVAGSLVGDGQPELIPPEIFVQHPDLLEGRGSIYQSAGKTSLYEYTLYTLLSSPVNGTCRFGNPYQAYNILKTCRCADDVISHPVYKDHQDVLNKEITSIINEFGRNRKTRRNTKYIGNFLVATISSKFRIASRFATQLSSNVKNKTVVVINDENGAISVRGNLATWLRDKMVPLGWTVGGHAGYMGGSVGDRSDEEFIADLRKAVNNPTG